MTQALISCDAVDGSKLDTTIASLVQLDTTNNGGELTYLWSIVDQPAGTADALSSAVIKNPTITVNKEGHYLIQLIVNQGYADEVSDTVIIEVKQLKTRISIPAANETTEKSSTRGTALDVNAALQLVDTMRADPGIVVAQLANTLAALTVVHFTASATIKSGLPGQEKVPVVDTALATQNYIQQSPCGILLSAVDGGALTAGKLVYVRLFGMLTSVALPSITTADRIYVSDTGTLSRTAGSKTRQIGTALNGSGGTGDIYINGLNE